MRATSSASTGWLRAGTEYWAVRWNTTSRRACSAITGIDCTADEPVPMIPTRCPLKSTPACGQRPV